MTPRWTILLFCAVLANAAEAAPGDKTNLVRDLAGRVGPVIGSALTCPDIARPRIQLIVDKFTAVIAEAATSETERSGLTQPARSQCRGRPWRRDVGTDRLQTGGPPTR